MLRWFTERGAAAGVPVVRIKNRFALARSDVPDGYRDLKARDGKRIILWTVLIFYCH